MSARFCEPNEPLHACEVSHWNHAPAPAPWNETSEMYTEQLAAAGAAGPAGLASPAL
ncbi:hypothetical protein [Streptomyces guryensis]|uniref:Uncharacterized protein n=1 Tax=Streptomyces guryensis TaxID=2886947 RepID=A0A9Q3VML3_9ACTN|nr:hypothetical protein [Streptomyces guryensis]MCD9875071.1 hypothetical protein [Streptomyces guryensis]